MKNVNKKIDDINKQIEESPLSKEEAKIQFAEMTEKLGLLFLNNSENLMMYGMLLLL